MKKALLLILIITLCAGCAKKEKKPTFGLDDTGSGHGRGDETNTILYQHRDLSK